MSRRSPTRKSKAKSPSKRSPKTKSPPRRSPTRKTPPSKQLVKDCYREWVLSPVTGRAIEVQGKTWFELYPTHKKYLDTAERKTTPGITKNGVCTPPKGDPPHDWDRGRGRYEGGYRGRRRWEGGGWNYYNEPYVAPGLNIGLHF